VREFKAWLGQGGRLPPQLFQQEKGKGEEKRGLLGHFPKKGEEFRSPMQPGNGYGYVGGPRLSRIAAEKERYLQGEKRQEKPSLFEILGSAKKEGAFPSGKGERRRETRCSGRGGEKKEDRPTNFRIRVYKTASARGRREVSTSRGERGKKKKEISRSGDKRSQV